MTIKATFAKGGIMEGERTRTEENVLFAQDAVLVRIAMYQDYDFF